jgi:hypothetical protein
MLTTLMKSMCCLALGAQTRGALTRSAQMRGARI